MNRCRSCNAEIIWATFDSGRRVPLDAKPVENGTIALDGERARVLIRGETAPRRYRSHFVSCPHAGQWRKK